MNTDLYTSSKVSIKKRVESGLTFLFETEPEAIERANKLGSYYYVAFEVEKAQELKQYCYAVPK